MKRVEFSSDETDFVQLKAKPNFRVLGKKVGKLMRAAQVAIDAFDQTRLELLLNGNNVTLTLEGEEIIITPEDVEVDRIVHEGMVAANDGEITLALDTTLDEALLIEGIGREMVNKINTMRKEAGFEVSDRIRIKMQTTDRVKTCFELHGDYIQNEVLALSVKFQECGGEEWDINGEPTRIVIEKVPN